MDFYLACIMWAVLGTLVAALISCFLPGLHVYNVKIGRASCRERV